jgi:antitoxin ParD1/3/4
VPVKWLGPSLSDDDGQIPCRIHTVVLSTVAIKSYSFHMARQATLNVSLTTKLQKYVRSKVKSGRYESASEVIRESLRALQERERATEKFWTDVRDKVAIARRQVADGQTRDGAQAMDEILTELDGEPMRSHKAKKKVR